MSFGLLLQILVDVVLIAAISYLWIRSHRPPKDDPRLSRGLQLLQSKISVLEDLSDRTETQVSQVSAILESKVKDLQNYIASAEKQVRMIEASMSRSLEVAKIFQDKIPHEEIIERQNTIKYVRAAQMAHKGLEVAEIAKVVDLPVAELEFIAKVNRNELQFSESDLPDWVKEEVRSAPSTLSALGQKFRSAMEGSAPMTPAKPQVMNDVSIASPSATEVTSEIRKVQFPKI